MKGKTEKILCGFSSIFPKYLGKYARKMRAGRYETGSEGKFASRWRAKSPDALCAVLPQKNRLLYGTGTGFSSGIQNLQFCFTSASSPQKLLQTRLRFPVPEPWSAAKPQRSRSVHTGMPAAAHKCQIRRQSEQSGTSRQIP